MPIAALYANLACSDLARSRAWYATLMGREPDAEPMEGLVEWHHGEGAGLQLYAGEGAAKAGHGTLTLIVSGLRAERERLRSLDPGEVEPGDLTSLVRLADPDGNLVVLAQPGRA